MSSSITRVLAFPDAGGGSAMRTARARAASLQAACVGAADSICHRPCWVGLPRVRFTKLYRLHNTHAHSAAAEPANTTSPRNRPRTTRWVGRIAASSLAIAPLQRECRHARRAAIIVSFPSERRSPLLFSARVSPRRTVALAHSPAASPSACTSACRGSSAGRRKVGLEADDVRCRRQLLL